MKDVLNSLKKIGLSSNESKVYYNLLKMGESKAGIISKKASINRTTTYDCLKSLIDKGLVSYVIKSNNKHFRAAPPNQLKSFLHEKEMQVDSILPDLKKVYNKPDEKHNVTLYTGYKGMKTVFQDFIKTAGKNGLNLVMDSEGQFVERMPYFAPHFINLLEKNNIKVKHIVRRGHDIKPSKTTEVRFIDKKEPSQASINIIGNKTTIIIWSDTPEAVVIENKSLSDNMKYYFEQIWKGLKE